MAPLHVPRWSALLLPVAADADDTNEGVLRADEPGRATFACSVQRHEDSGMEGTLIVEAP